MAKKTKLTEAELIEQNPAPAAAPVQAQPEEVQAAQAAAPVAEPAPAAEEPLVAEQPEAEAPAPEEPAAEPAAETVAVEVQIPTDQLAAAVAQVTGDIEAAEQAPDIEAEKQSEIASIETPEAEAAPEDQPIDTPVAEEPAAINESAETAPAEYNAEDEKDGESTSEPVADAEKEYSIIKEAEDKTCPECGKNPCECEGVCPECGKNPCECEEQCKEECDGDPECEAACEEECAEEEADDEDVGDIDVEGLFDDDASDVEASRLADIFGGEEEVEETIDALNTSADFLNKILNMGDEFEAEEEAPVEPEDAEEPADENPITGANPEPLASDPKPAEEPEEEMKESLDFNKLIGRAKAKGFEALGGMDALEREIEEYKNHPEKYAHNPLKPLIDNLLVKRGFMDEYHNWIEDSDEDMSDNYLDSLNFEDDEPEDEIMEDDEYDEFAPEDEEDIDLPESKKNAAPKMKEAIIYPAGSKPLGSEINNAEEDNLVKAYEKTAAARRQALSNFRESMRKTSATSQNKAKFSDALSNRKLEESAPINKKSWKANRFEEKYEERQKLNYKDLLNNGYLG